MLRLDVSMTLIMRIYGLSPDECLYLPMPYRTPKSDMIQTFAECLYDFREALVIAIELQFSSSSSLDWFSSARNKYLQQAIRD